LFIKVYNRPESDEYNLLFAKILYVKMVSYKLPISVLYFTVIIELYAELIRHIRSSSIAFKV